jgi:hypothetical protein
MRAQEKQLAILLYIHRYGRIIISERFLPAFQKTIKPIDAIGGTAGGLKYICGGLKLKLLAVDGQFDC